VAKADRSELINRKWYDTAKFTDKFTVSQRVNLAVQNMLAAARFSRRVAELEDSNKSQPFGSYWEEILHNAIASVMCCSSSLEAYANELFFEREAVFPKFSAPLLDNLRDTYERKTPLEKFEFALLLSEKSGIDKGVALLRHGYLKKHDKSSAMVGTSRLRSRNRFLISQLVSAIRRHPWQAAPWVARSPLLSSGS
jgi:hypothetical protein